MENGLQNRFPLSLSKDSLKIDMDYALLADRGNSENEIETNKTLKMINQRIKDFENEISLFSKLN